MNLTQSTIDFPLTQNKILLGDTNGRCSEKTFVEAGLESLNNKVTTFSSPTDVQYPSAKLVYDSLNSSGRKFQQVIGTDTNNDFWQFANNGTFYLKKRVGGGWVDSLDSGTQTAVNSLQSSINNVSYNVSTLISVGVNTTYYNVYVGAALNSTGGSECTAYGYGALQFNNGNDNTAIGYNSQNLCTTGYNNTTLGSYTGAAFSSAFNNVAIGHQAMLNNSTSNDNVAIGYLAMVSTLLSNRSVAIGSNAGGNLGTTITSDDNIAIGYYALHNTNNTGNIGIGSYAGNSNNDGFNNIFIGFNAANTNNGLNNNIYIGANTINSASASNEIILGTSGIGLGSNTVAIGNSTTLKTQINGALQVNSTAGNPLIGTNTMLHVSRPNSTACNILITNNSTTSQGLQLEASSVNASISNLNTSGYLDFKIGTASKLYFDVTSVIKLNNITFSDNQMFALSITNGSTFTVPAGFVLEAVTVKSAASGSTATSIAIGTAAGLTNVVPTTTISTAANTTKRLVVTVDPDEQFWNSGRIKYITIVGGGSNLTLYPVYKRLTF